jgi:hypothetical protein
MRNTVKAVGILAILMLAAASGITKVGTAPADDRRSDDHTSDGHGSIVIVFKDGHRQDVKVGGIARMEFTTPVLIVFKDGHQQNVPAEEIARIEFEPAGASAASRAHFVGKWEVGDGNGSNFYITLEASGDARKSIGASRGTWTVVDGEARISWDDGWHDAIRKVGPKHEKVAFAPGKSFADAPSNITAARNTQPKPI